MARLGVTIDMIAAMRGERRGKEPDPVAAAMQAEIGGADGIVATLRDDRKYITDRDVDLLKEVITTHFNLRLAAHDEMVKKAIAVLPDMVTLLPVQEADSHCNAGIDVVASLDYLEDFVATLRASNIVVCMKIDPEIKQVKAAARAGADYVDFNTHLLTNAQDLNTQTEELEKLRSVAIAANKLGLGVSASNGINYQNVRELSRISQIEEINIGHAIICRALMVGIERSVRDMYRILREPRPAEEK